MVIYKTINLINGKYYVGKDEKNNPEYLGSGLLLNKAIKKYGKENFKKEILEICVNRKELNEREIYWIENLDATKKGYNIALGGSGGDTYSNNPKLPTIIKKLSGENNHFYGKHHSNETKQLMSKKHSGKDAWNKGLVNIYSEEHLLNLSNIRKEKYSGENHPRFIDIPKDKLLELLINNNLKEVAEFFNISLDCVRKKIKKYNINYKTIKIKTGPKVGKTPNYYEISDKLFEKILETRERDKKSIEELSDEFKIGINKLRKEFKNRNVIVKKIK